MQDSVLAYVCLVRLPRLAGLLSERETRRITKPAFATTPHRTGKRELEYLGGRMAAKLAAAAWNAKDGSVHRLDWDSFLIRAGADEQRVCYRNGAYAASIGITHSGRWAAAIAIPGRKVAMDLEDAQGRAIVPSAFHKLELQNGPSAGILREYWTLKETIAKLCGKGVLGFENEIFTYSHDGRRWIGVICPGFLTGHALVAARTNQHFSMAIGLD